MATPSSPPSPPSSNNPSSRSPSAQEPSKMDRFKKCNRRVMAHIKKELTSFDFFLACFFEAMAAFFFYYIVYSVHINATVNLFLSSESIALVDIQGGTANATAPSQVLFNSAVFPTDINFLIEAVSTGITLTLVVLVLGPLSGAHVNPLVTFSFMLVGNFPIVRGIVYIITQMGASVVAAALAPLSFYAAYGPPFISTEDATGYPYVLSNYTVVYPFPGATSPQVLLMEVMLAFFFIFFVFMISFDPETAVYIPSKSIRRRYSIVPSRRSKRITGTPQLDENNRNGNVDATGQHSHRAGEGDLEQGNLGGPMAEDEPLQQKSDSRYGSPSLERNEAQSLTRRSIPPTDVDVDADADAADATAADVDADADADADTNANTLLSSNPQNSSADPAANTADRRGTGSIAAQRARASRSLFSSPYYRLEKSIDINQQQSLQFIISVSFGFLITLIIWVGSSVSGGAFNPARVFGPAIINNEWTYQWTYWVGGLLGSVIASGFYVFVYRKARVRAMEIASQKAKEIYEANL